MKASDICVGDWLNIYTFPNDNPKKDDLFPAMVSAVSVFDQFKDPDDVTVELVIPNTNGIASRPLGTCLPIKLTESILVKNGFYRSPRWHYCEITTDDGFKIYVQLGCGGTIDYVSITKHNSDIMERDIDVTVCIHYFHELQHLLRLCGVEKELTI